MKHLITLLITIFALAYLDGQIPGIYNIQSALEGKYLDVKDGKNHNGNGLHLWPGNGGLAQKFKLISAENGYFYIESQIGKKTLAVKNISPDPQTPVVIWDHTPNQINTLWKFIPTSDGYYFIQSKLGTYLDVQWGKSTDGTPIWMWTGNGGNAQKWKLIPFSNNPVPTGSQRKMTSFDPEKHGFKFSNRFDNNGTVFGAHLNFTGLCGGMSYAALDYYFANTAIPSISDIPQESNSLTHYIRSRQWKSYENQAIKWSELVLNPFGMRTSEFWHWGVQGFNGGRLEELKNEIDKGKPVILGLFSTGDGGFSKGHHQVIAIGYELNGYDGLLKSNMDNLKIFICDPNYPNRIMTLRPDSKNSTYYYEENKSQNWLTYFVDRNYSPTKPLDPNVINRCTKSNFENMDRSGKTLNNQNYRCARANNVNFRGATISGTDFTNSTIIKGNFYGANLQHSNFSGSNMTNCNFHGADMQYTIFPYAILKGARLYGANCKRSDMSYVFFDGANLEGADLYLGNFQGSSFKGCWMKGTSLNSATLVNVSFEGANLDGADLRGANLKGANFKNATITRNTLYDKGSIKDTKNWP